MRDFVFQGSREYGDFLKLREGISTNILASRLQWLTEVGVFTKHGHPTNGKKYYYEITDKGFDLVEVIMTLAQWGWKHIPGGWSPAEVKRLFVRDRRAFANVWRKRVRERSREYLRDAQGSHGTA